eukprot:SAG31_NODE_97_length_25714_cov_19.477142_6_plen_430_part_00
MNPVSVTLTPSSSSTTAQSDTHALDSLRQEDARAIHQMVQRFQASTTSVLPRLGRFWAEDVLHDLDCLARFNRAAGHISLPPLRPDIPVGGRLRHFAPLWAALFNDPYCTSVLYDGLIPEFRDLPPYRGPCPLRPLARDQRRPMRLMLQELLNLRVIQRLSPDEERSPYVHRHGCGLAAWTPPHALRPCYSTYFLVPKHDGGFRGCLDLRFLNQYVRSPHFKMETLQTFKAICQPGDWMTSIDLRHAYLHTPLHPAYRQTHRFRQLDPDTDRPTTFQFRAMTFGLNCAPRVFTRLVRPVAALLRQRYGIRLCVYLDDVAILGRSRAECSRHTAVVAAAFRSLGLLLNQSKSELEPVQHGRKFLGLEPDLRAHCMVLRLPQAKRHAMQRSCRQLLSFHLAYVLPNPMSSGVCHHVLASWRRDEILSMYSL